MNDNELVKNWIDNFVSDYGKTHNVETKWKEPVVGVADASDSLYKELKTIISPMHALPSEIVPGAKSVIVFFVPFAESIVKSNIPEEESSREWDYAYIETNQMLAELNTYLGHGPSMKETTLHYYRDPLLDIISKGPDVNLRGVVIVGTSDVFKTKYLTAKRVSRSLECMSFVIFVNISRYLKMSQNPFTEF